MGIIKTLDKLNPIQMLIITITGMSGTGKDTAARYIASRTGWEVIASYTTRPMREGEVNGREHIFRDSVTPKEIMDSVASTRYGGYFYWTTWKQFEHTPVSIYIIDEHGLDRLQTGTLYEGYKLFKIHIVADFDVLEDRGVDVERLMRDAERAHLQVNFAYDAEVDNSGTEDELYAQLDRVIELIREYSPIARKH